MQFARAALEEREIQTLAPYGLKSRASQGRQYPEAEPDDRTAFQRDRDRVLHTTAFRRLEYKTQVFINSEGDYYRTRLTHTLEVAQIGRTLARALGANEDLVEAICLAHDIGHPAFGHSGEVALADQMREHGGFDHNRQSLRIVERLERRYPAFPGLNLTWEAREGIVKHETEYDVSDAAGFDPDQRGHLEAQICNAADELAYTAHDVDDGLRSGLLRLADLAGLDLWQHVRQSVDWDGQEWSDLLRHRMIRRVIGLEVRDVVASTSARIEASRARTPDDLQRLDHNVIGFSSEMAARNRQLKDFLYNNMYRHYRVVRMQVKAERIIGDLFGGYLREPAQLPPEVQDRIDEDGVHRVVCDYIAGMTDRYALEEHAKLFDPKERP